MATYEWACRNPHCPMDEFELVLTMQQIEDGYEATCPCCDYLAERILSTFNGTFGDTEKFHGD